jgi:hypothetical protein
MLLRDKKDDPRCDREVLSLGLRLVASCALTLLVSLFAAAVSLAGPPTHQPVPSLDMNGANTPAHEFIHPCGVATDSEGDVYIASPGADAIDVFNAAHEFLTAIPDSGEPCALAVGAEGVLYATQRASGEVVRYTPMFYPFVGAPAYGPAATIDASGHAKGISVDPVDERLYVAEGDRVATYSKDGELGINEVQRLDVAGSGTFKLSFGGDETAALSSPATPAQVQTALEALPTIGAGNVRVIEGESEGGPSVHVYLIEFVGAFAREEMSSVACDGSGLTNSCGAKAKTPAFSGIVGEGEVSEATGIAAYTYVGGTNIGAETEYLYVAEKDGSAVKTFTGHSVATLAPSASIDGARTPAGGFTLGQEAYLAVDSGNSNPGTLACEPVQEQACTAGHLLVYDAAHDVIDEFDASGEYIDQISSAKLSDSAPTAMTVDRSGTASDGTIYTTSGSEEALAFAPLPAPTHASLSSLSRELLGAHSVAVDTHGDVYVATEHKIEVFDPAHKLLSSIQDTHEPEHVAVDTEGNVYVLNGNGGFVSSHSVEVYHPAAYPPTEGTSYGPPTTIVAKVTGHDIAINPHNNHLFLTLESSISEYDSAADGSVLLNSHFGAGTPANSQMQGIAVYGANGDVYVTHGNGLGVIEILNPAGTRVLRTITRAGSPTGPGVGGGSLHFAINQRNGHVIVFGYSQEDVQEFDASGAFVSSFGSFQSVLRLDDVAVDNSGGASEGNVYVAFDEPEPGTPDLWAFGPLDYGEAPAVTTGAASEVEGAGASVAGTVDPSGFEVSECRFEYLTQTEYAEHGETFSGAKQAACQQTSAEIGNGTKAVSVTARLTGLQAEGRYRFRLAAKDRFGERTGAAGMFGVPIVSSEQAEALYDEATVQGAVNPFGLPTSYYVEYGTSNAYGNTTATRSLPAGDTPVRIEATAFGLAAGAEYHYRIVAQNEAGTVDGPDATLTTLPTIKASSCPNAQDRVGTSTPLPDCRAYELVTQPNLGLSIPYLPGGTLRSWFVSPYGPTAGDRLTYFSEIFIPGQATNGFFDGWTAVRGASGWQDDHFGPSGKETAEHLASQKAGPGFTGMSPEQEYSSWQWLREQVLYGSEGSQAIGSSGPETDVHAPVDALGSHGEGIVFSSTAHLLPEAPPAGTNAVYERSLWGGTKLVSLLPGEVTPGSGEDAIFEAVSSDGSTVAFEIGGRLYVRRAGETVEVAQGVEFAGFSDGGERIYYEVCKECSGRHTAEVEAGALFEFNLASDASTEIVANAKFVNISSDGSRVYLTSTERLDQAGEGVPGKHNLYLREEGQVRLVAVLAQSDLEEFMHDASVNIGDWLEAARPLPAGTANGLAYLSPTRATADGEVLVFQSHADLTGQDPDEDSEVYRYDAGDGNTVCVSCNPTGSVAHGEADLQWSGGVATDATIIPNLTENGQTVVFESEESLVPQDENSYRDVYEWEAPGTGGCTQTRGCVSLLSGGKARSNSYLYAMTPDASDVFFLTYQQLLPEGVKSSPAIYDARVDGGFAPAPEAKSCVESGCQGPAGSVPSSPSLGSATFHGAVNPAPTPQPGGKATPKPSRKTAQNSAKKRLAQALKSCKRRYRHRPRAERRCTQQARKRLAHNGGGR